MHSSITYAMDRAYSSKPASSERVRDLAGTAMDVSPCSCTEGHVMDVVTWLWVQTWNGISGGTGKISGCFRLTSSMSFEYYSVAVC